MKIAENTVDSALRYFKNALVDLYGVREVSSIARIVFEHLFGLNTIQLVTEKPKRLSESDLVRLIRVVKRLKKEEPLQYILGETEFYGLTFKIHSPVLIPRPETEELVQWVLSDLEKHQSETKVIDLCSGSGCVGISIAKNTTRSSVTCVDIEMAAIRLGKTNAEKLSVHVKFIQCDILNSDIDLQPYQVVVCNPPYVLKSEQKLMAKNVLEFEPGIALFVDDENPLQFYKRIIELVLATGKRKVVFFEINEQLKTKLTNMLQSFRISTFEFRKDLNGKFRLLRLEI